MIPAGARSGWQWKRLGIGQMQWQVRKDKGTGCEKGRQMAAHNIDHVAIVVLFVRSDIAMGEDRGGGKTLLGLGQGIFEFADEHEPRVGNAIRKAVDFPVEDIDIAPRKIFAQMIEGAAMAETQLENGAGCVRNLGKCPGQAGMLRLETVEERFEARILHAPSIGPRVPESKRRLARKPC